jgi:integrase/recombinase XerD
MAPAQKAGEIGETTGILLQGYSAHLVAVLGLSQNTEIAYASAVTKWAAWWRRPVEFFHEEEWDDWTAYLHKDGLSAKTINLHHVALKRFFKYLRRRKLLTHDPASLSETLRTPKRLPVWLTEAEVDKVIAGASCSRDRAMLEILYACGLRNSECRTLELGQIRGDFVEVHGKGLKERVVPIPRRSRPILDGWLDRRPTRTDYVFPTNRDGPFDIASFNRLVGKTARSAGLKKRVGPHTFRHSIATHLAIRGVPAEKIQRFLGHESIATTMIYIHLAESLVQRAILDAHPRSE